MGDLKRSHFAVKESMKWGYKRLEKISPPFAYKLYSHLLYKPFKSTISLKEESAMRDSEKHEFELGNKKVAFYKWGKLSDRRVLFVHGWSGRAAHGLGMKDYFVDNGYEFIALDLPAHGKSTGRKTTILECADAVNAVVEKLGKVDLVIGHSFGGAVIANSRRVKNVIRRHVAIGTPHNLEFVLKSYQNLINASSSANRYVRDLFSKKWNVSLEEIHPSNIYDKLDAKSILLIHDEHDKEVPVSMSKEISMIHPEIKFVETKKLGHRRILKDQRVIRHCHKFLTANETKVIDGKPILV